MSTVPDPVEPEAWSARVRGAFKRFFHEQEPGFTVRSAAFVVAFGLIQITLYAALFIGLYLAVLVWIQLVELSYSSPKNYLLYSVLPLLGLSFIFGVGQALWELLSDDLPRWRRRRKARRKRRADGRPG